MVRVECNCKDCDCRIELDAENNTIDVSNGYNAVYFTIDTEDAQALIKELEKWR